MFLVPSFYVSLPFWFSHSLGFSLSFSLSLSTPSYVTISFCRLIPYLSDCPWFSLVHALFLGSFLILSDLLCFCNYPSFSLVAISLALCVVIALSRSHSFLFSISISLFLYLDLSKPFSSFRSLSLRLDLCQPFSALRFLSLSFYRALFLSLSSYLSL